MTKWLELRIDSLLQDVCGGFGGQRLLRPLASHYVGRNWRGLAIWPFLQGFSWRLVLGFLMKGWAIAHKHKKRGHLQGVFGQSLSNLKDICSSEDGRKN